MTTAERSGQYFSTEPTVTSRPQRVTLHLPDGSLELRSDRGVFAPDAVDVGTRYLLLDAPMPPAGATGNFLDLGCGYGPIALSLARRCPRAQIWAVDVNQRALELCRQNADAHSLPNVVVSSAGEVPPEVVFDGLYANPPIRIGKAALEALLLQWLARLTPTAEAFLVVHRHLGADSLQRWLEGHGHPSSRLGSRLGYRLLRVLPRAAEGT